VNGRIVLCREFRDNTEALKAVEREAQITVSGTNSGTNAGKGQFLESAGRTMR
jgi:hypothetical protein